MKSYGGPGSDGRRDRGRIVPGEEKEITVPAQESIMKEGWKPDQF